MNKKWWGVIGIVAVIVILILIFGVDKTISLSPGEWCDGTDLDKSGSVNWGDFSIFASQWLGNGTELSADFDNSGSVNWADFSIFASHWMESNCSGVQNPSCTDSDGTDVLTLGSVTGTMSDGTPYTIVDFCTVSTYIGELICYENGSYGIYGFGGSWNCKNLGASYYCEDGVCTNATSPVENPSCIDSDGGAKPLITGSVTGTFSDGTPYTYADSCLSDAYIHEYVCYENGSYSLYGTDGSWNCRNLGLSYDCQGGQCYNNYTHDVYSTLNYMSDSPSSRIYNLGNGSYNITLTFMNSTSSKFSVNGQNTNNLIAGWVAILPNGSRLRLLNMTYNSDIGQSKAASFWFDVDGI